MGGAEKMQVAQHKKSQALIARPVRVNEDMRRLGPDNAASSRNPIVTISAVGAELCRDAEGGIIVILGNRVGQSAAYRLPDRVAFDLENLLRGMRALANDTGAETVVTNITAEPRTAVGIESAGRLSPRACIAIIGAASVAAWAGIACAASLLF
jgi:hypothetical protein